MDSRPDWVGRINYLGPAAGGSHHLIGMDPDELVEIAKSSLGLSDFHDLDGWRSRYEEFLGQISKNETLHTLGRLITKSNLLRILRNRLLITEYLKNNDETSRLPVTSPIIIVGGPRSGTTLLHNLLAQDDRLRPPLTWEAAFPTSSPYPSTTKHRPEQLAQCIDDLAMDIEPMIKAMHYTSWNSPVECAGIMHISLRRNLYFCTNYAEWHKKMLPHHCYQWHKKILQILQHRNAPRRWILKCPLHLHFLDELFQTYPDAKILYLHRDPYKSITSLLQITEYVTSTVSNTYEISNTKERINLWALGQEKAMRDRNTNKIPNNQILDIQYVDLLRNPESVLEKIYSHANIGLPKITKEKILSYLKEKHSYAHGKYSYSAEKYGTNKHEIRDRFRNYIDYYQIPEE